MQNSALFITEFWGIKVPPFQCCNKCWFEHLFLLFFFLDWFLIKCNRLHSYPTGLFFKHIFSISFQCCKKCNTSPSFRRTVSAQWFCCCEDVVMASSQVNNMLDLTLNIFLTLLAFIGFLFNVYIVISVAMTKQVCSRSFSTFHSSWKRRDSNYGFCFKYCIKQVYQLYLITLFKV